MDGENGIFRRIEEKGKGNASFIENSLSCSGRKVGEKKRKRKNNMWVPRGNIRKRERGYIA